MSLDRETRALRAVLRKRDKLRASLAVTDRDLRTALDAWCASRPGAVRGTATEAGARYLLGQSGLL